MSDWIHRYLSGQWDASHWRFAVLNAVLNMILFGILLSILKAI